ncbi:MAG: papain-like cysteine protease family protein [Vulcanimicrobiota bacterium]
MVTAVNSNPGWNAPFRPQPAVLEETVGIPTDEFVASARPQDLGRQQRSNWCWAACIQMVMGFHGIPSQQAAIVASTFGAPIDRPGRPLEILANLNGLAVDANGRPAAVSTDSTHLDDATIVADLAQRRPLIVGLTGHAYVMTGAYFHRDQFGNPVIDGVVLRDPWPDSPSRQEMSAAEFSQRLQFATRIRVDR